MNEFTKLFKYLWLDKCSEIKECKEKINLCVDFYHIRTLKLLLLQAFR
jgi:hypothetical protein